MSGTVADGARVRDIEVAGTEAFLVEPTAGGRGPAVLFLHWFDTQVPDGNRTQPQAVADRAAFLGPLLGWADA